VLKRGWAGEVRNASPLVPDKVIAGLRPCAAVNPNHMPREIQTDR
jgi:hypothetical protein